MLPWNFHHFVVDTNQADYKKKETINTMYKNLFYEMLDSVLPNPITY